MESEKVKTYFVYRLTLPNGRIYIGYTSAGVQTRFSWHWKARKKLKTPLHKCLALLSSPSEVLVETVWQGADKNEALLREMCTIHDECSLITENGLNMTKGGESPPDNFGGNSWMIGKTEQELLEINAKKARSGDKNPFFGKTHSTDTLAVAVATRRERGSYNSAIAAHLHTDDAKERNRMFWKSPEGAAAMRKTVKARLDATARRIGYENDEALVAAIRAIEEECLYSSNEIAKKLHTSKDVVLPRMSKRIGQKERHELRKKMGVRDACGD